MNRKEYLRFLNQFENKSFIQLLKHRKELNEAYDEHVKEMNKEGDVLLKEFPKIIFKSLFEQIKNIKGGKECQKVFIVNQH